jgi:GNAT superfamily N-acetyltransferase
LLAALKRVIEVTPIIDAEYSLAFRTMRENMISYHEVYDLPWNQDSIDRHFRRNQNYSIFSSTSWIGFLSLEWREVDLFIHTLQLSKKAQGGVYGARVYDWILEQLHLRGKSKITCKTFCGSPMIDLYKRIGFTEVARENHLATLEKRINKSRLMDASRRSSKRYVP